MIEPIAITVAGEEPDTAANSAQAITPASPRPPYQCPTIEVAKLIMRRATPPWVRKLPARMKNGIAMISKLSMPVNSFSATDSVGTLVIVKMKVSTVMPSAIEIGMPVSISAISSPKMISAAHRVTSAAPMPGSFDVDALDMGVVVMRQLAGAQVVPGDLQEAEAHQIGAERNAEIDEPARHLEIGRDLVGVHQPDRRISRPWCRSRR